MSRTWGSFLQNHRAEKQVRQAIVDGNLYAAADMANRSRVAKSKGGSELVRKLTECLISRSQEYSLQGNVAAAWKDLTVASSVAVRSDFDRLAGEKSTLVELTLELANAQLQEGRLSSAQRTVSELRNRRILDWRADQIEKSVSLLQEADGLVAKGELRKATDRLMEARNLRPDLRFVESKLAGIQTRIPQFRALKTALRHALLKTDWPEVERCCSELLEIAPCYQVALDARRRLESEKSRKQSPWRLEEGTSEMAHPNATAKAAAESAMAKQAAKNVKFEYVPETQESPSARGANKTKIATAPPPISGSRASGRQQAGPENLENQKNNQSMSETDYSANESKHESPSAVKPFMLWIDGVGGYLVCPETNNTLGQAVGGNDLQIPMRGDLLGQHLVFRFVDRTLVCEPLGPVQVDGETITEPVPVKDGQSLEVGPIKLRVKQAHPLSGSVLLSFESRHRTHPWSDGVLLVNGPLLLGRSRRNHVVCRNWEQELLLFLRDGKLWIRTKGKIEVDGIVHENEAELTLNSRVCGEDFSLSLEAL